jgi:phosphoglycolate phosphatase
MALLFDLDGTLIDTAPDFVVAINQLRATKGLPSLSDHALTQVRFAVAEGTQAIATAGFELTPEQLTLEHPHATLCQQLLETYQQNLGVQAKLFPGMAELLNTLEQQHIPWGIVTNKQARFTKPLLQQLGLIDRATCVVSGDTTAHYKPHPAPLLHACTQMALAPQQCIYVGDAKQDIVAGRAAGMTTIVALFGYSKDLSSVKEWGAHHTVKHPDEIFPWFKAWLKARA